MYISKKFNEVQRDCKTIQLTKSTKRQNKLIITLLLYEPYTWNNVTLYALLYQ